MELKDIHTSPNDAQNTHERLLRGPVLAPFDLSGSESRRCVGWFERIYLRFVVTSEGR